MGWGFRRSKKVGPFRLSLGKKGLGVSVGVKGARIGVGADGRVRQSISIPGTGLSYRKTLSAGSGSAPAASSSSSSPSGCLVLLALFPIVYAVGLAAQNQMLPQTLIVGAAIAAAIFFVRRRRAQEAQRQAEQRATAERQALVDRFGEAAADLIAIGDPWQGATQPMIEAMLGPPADVARKVLKKSTRETWKYGQIGKNRFVAKIMFEDGVCVGWDIPSQGPKT